MVSLDFLQIPFLLLVVFVFPLVDLWASRELKTFTSESRRLLFYRVSFVTSWLVTGVAGLLLGRAWSAVFQSQPPHWAGLHTIRGALLAVVLLAFFALNLSNGVRSFWNPRIRAALAKHLRKLYFMTPVSGRERAWFAALSITAGVCEEYLFRGYMMHVLQVTVRLPLLFAFVVTSVTFGFAHLYQGRSGVLGTMLAGFAFGLLALLTGGLVVPMVVHALVDLQVLTMYQPRRDNPELAAKLLAGTHPMTA